MVDKICKIKDELLAKIEKEISERGLDRIDSQNLGETVDMVKDLAIAEEKCWKASYYHKLVEAMGEDDSRGQIESLMSNASQSERDLVRKVLESMESMH